MLNSVVFNYGIEKTNKKATSQRVIAFFTIFAKWTIGVIGAYMGNLPMKSRFESCIVRDWIVNSVGRMAVL